MKIGTQVLAAPFARLTQAFCMAALLVMSVRSRHQVPSCPGALSCAAHAWVTGTGCKLANLLWGRSRCSAWQHMWRLCCTTCRQQSSAAELPGNARHDACGEHHLPSTWTPARVLQSTD